VGRAARIESNGRFLLRLPPFRVEWPEPSTRISFLWNRESLMRLSSYCGTFCAAWLLLITFFAPFGSAQSYRLERIASGLNQPTYITQAPGDPPNILYYSTRIDGDIAPGNGGGFGAVNPMGGIFRYDTNTRTSTEIMSLAHRTLTGDEGLVGFAFSTDFNTPGAPGYQKLYVSSSQRQTGSPVDRVEEYTVSGPNGTVPLDSNNRPVRSRLILQYTHVNTQQNHTVDWIGFDPLAKSLPVGTAERNYLYIVTGDGDLGGSAINRPEQQADDLRGKMLRVDVDVTRHGDAYGSDGNKNFAIPPTNPIPLWNSLHPTGQKLNGTIMHYTSTPNSVTYAPALGEIYFTGLRNSFRTSFDLQTGDFWGGDVGENAREEINFLKANPYDGAQPPYDFGYAQREGTLPTAGTSVPNTVAGNVTGSTGATTLEWDFDGTGTGSIIVNSINPIREGPHSAINTPDEIRNTGRSSYIGGYVYRGPVAELQGKYFYSDFVNGNIFALEFNRNTPLDSYSGTNLNQVNGLATLGTRTTVLSSDANSLWQALITDPTDPTYTSAIGGQFGIGRVVSFGEDNAGNLYIIDFGGNRGDTSFGGDYAPAGRGEIFRITPIPEPGTGVLVFLLVAELLLMSRRKAI
jgi:hypothetical protein